MGKKLCKKCGTHPACECLLLNDDFDVLIDWPRDRLRRMARVYAQGGDVSRMIVDICREVSNLELDLATKTAECERLRKELVSVFGFLKRIEEGHLDNAEQIEPPTTHEWRSFNASCARNSQTWHKRITTLLTEPSSKGDSDGT